jgi:hypothetical protein
MSIIPATQEAEIRRIRGTKVQGQPRKKVSKTAPPISTKYPSVVAYAYHPKYEKNRQRDHSWRPTHAKP